MNAYPKKVMSAHAYGQTVTWTVFSWILAGSSRSQAGRRKPWYLRSAVSLTLSVS